MSVGDVVAAEDALITLESDKASMDIPSPQAGVVREMKIAVGDKVSEGTLVCMLDGRGRGRCRGAGRAAQAPTGVTARQRRIRSAMRDAGAGSGSRRLHCRLSGRRPGHEDRTGRALGHPWRGLPERRLYPLEGAAACGQGDRRVRGHGCAWHQVCETRGRYRCAAVLEGEGGRAPDRWPGRACQAAQGRGGAGCGCLRRSASCRGGRGRWQQDPW